MTSTKTRIAIISTVVIGMAIICGCGHKNENRQKTAVPTKWHDTSTFLSPFTKVRYDGDTVNVTYAGTEYQLAAIDDLSASDMLDFCRKKYGGIWQKRFAEDLVVVLEDMRHPINAEHTVDLTLVDAKTSEAKTIKGAMMTEANRAAVRDALSSSTNAPPANP
jgi:hypothetical protein